MRKFVLLAVVAVMASFTEAKAQQPLQADLNPSLYTPFATYYDVGSGQNFYYDSTAAQFMVLLSSAAPVLPSAYGVEAQLLSLINNWRATAGRGPVGWDSSLAYFASLNSGVHQPGTNGGGMQCWASPRDLIASFYMWVNSPPHAAILLNASTAIGAAICPSGSTLNAR
jgi:uncharacterized protein YkwD